MAVCHPKGGGRTPQLFRSLRDGMEQGEGQGLRQSMEHAWPVEAPLR